MHSNYALRCAVGDLMYDGYVYVYTDQVESVINEAQQVCKYTITKETVNEQYTKLSINYGIEYQASTLMEQLERGEI